MKPNQIEKQKDLTPLVKRAEEMAAYYYNVMFLNFDFFDHMFDKYFSHKTDDVIKHYINQYVSNSDNKNKNLMMHDLYNIRSDISNNYISKILDSIDIKQEFINYINGTDFYKNIMKDNGTPDVEVILRYMKYTMKDIPDDLSNEVMSDLVDKMWSSFSKTFRKIVENAIISKADLNIYISSKFMYLIENYVKRYK